MYKYMYKYLHKYMYMDTYAHTLYVYMYTDLSKAKPGEEKIPLPIMMPTMIPNPS
jgi:hypothetical protein